jgi:small-conductance mechanosensitive channel
MGPGPVEKRSKRRLLKAVILALFFLLPAFTIMAPVDVAAQDTPSGDATIWGYVYETNLKKFMGNMTVAVEREYYLGNSTVTDDNGYYSMDIPSGNYVLRILDEEHYIVYRLEFNVTSGEIKRLDFQYDTNLKAQSKVYGEIRHKLTLSPMTNVEVILYRRTVTGKYDYYDYDVTDEDGTFEMKVPAGHYYLQVWSEGERLANKSFQINYTEEKHFKLTLEQPSRAFTLENAFNLLKREIVNIVFMIIVIVVGLLLLASVDKAFDAIRLHILKKPRWYLDESILRFIEQVVKWNIVIPMLILIAYLMAHILDFVTTIWLPVWNSISTIYKIVLLIIFMRITLMIWKQVVLYLRGDHRAEKPKNILSSRMITIIEILGKYIWAGLFALGIILTALAAIGLRDVIVGGFVDSIIGNAGFIIFFLTLLIITYVMVRFMTSFFEDMKHRSTRFRPEMIEVASKGFKYFIYAIIGMILVFTILSAAGLGEIGQTLILVFSMIIGMVVSMAATGSIGNMLSGLVILSFKPFDEGDWVVIADKYTGEIIETNIMFTKLRDLEDEMVEIPNNLILSQGIVNWTTAAKRGGFAVEIDTSIGYDVPAKQVIKLMESSCEGVENVLKDRDPTVVLTEFYDHAIGYKLRAYIDTPHHRNKIRTAIMVNMQRKFSEAGVEILSPIYEMGRLERTPSPEEVKKRVPDFLKFE